jgi:hypothetical protein
MSSAGVVEGGSSAGEAFAGLAAALAGLAEVEWWRLSDAELAAAAVFMHGCESRVAAAATFAVGEVIGRGLPVAAGARTGGQWLRGLVPIAPGAARARADLAEAFGPEAEPNPDLVATRAAFAAGAVSAGHAGVVARTVSALVGLPGVDAQTLAEGEALLLEVAGEVDPGQLGRAGLRMRHALDPDAAVRLARDEDRQQELREAWLVQESTGMWRLHGYLPPLAGARLASALDPLSMPVRAVDGVPDARTGRMRTADAIDLLADLSLAARAGQPGGLPVRHGASTRLTVTADLSTLRAGLARLPSPAGPTAAGDQAGAAFGLVWTGEPGGWEISPLATQVLACDAEVVPMLLDDVTGRPLDVGDTMYPFPPKIRKAIEARDRGCTFPGCSAKPAWCHTHHLVPFGRSGRTSEANGALLCGRHHRLVHADGWTGRIVDGQVVWQPPDPGRGSDRVDELSNAHQQRYERALRHLARSWLARNAEPEPDDTG